jgi:hypothetical protein
MDYPERIHISARDLHNRNRLKALVKSNPFPSY